MKGDFTRDSFDPIKDFTRVMMQQGRPQVDADWNEQAAILWNFLRGLASDLIGPHGGPEGSCGFRIIPEGDFALLEKEILLIEGEEKLKEMLKGEGDFLIGPGRYYVDGMPCTNPHFISYSSQTDFNECALQKRKKKAYYLIYLDAWERHITDTEEESIREAALLGTDTCTRARLVWKVASLELTGYEKVPTCELVSENWGKIQQNWQPMHRGYLKARAMAPAGEAFAEPTTLSPGSRYRGLTNHLYRVEVHQGGRFDADGGPTFKFSRENGSVIFPVRNVAGKVVTLGHLGRDTRSSLQAGDWVELVDDEYELERRAEPLLRVEQVRSSKLQVTLTDQPKSTVGQDAGKHPLLRRWDQKEGDPRRGGLELRDGAAVIKEGEHGSFWLNLENGVQIQFKKEEPANYYRTGDYWMIPARVATGNVEWPQHGNEPEARGPQGVLHYYAPLAIVSFDGKGTLCGESDCRLKFKLPSHPGL